MLFIIFPGCDDSLPAYEQLPLELAGVVYHAGDHLALPGELQLVANRLVVVDHRAEKNVHIIDAQDGTRIASIAGVGEGPREIMYPGSIMVDVEGDVWILDVRTRRMLLLDLNKVTDPTDWAVTTVSFGGDVPNVGDARWVSPEQLVATGLFLRGRFGVLNSKGELLAEIAPTPSWREMPVTVAQQLYRSFLDVKPDRSRFVAATQHFGQIEVFLPDGTLDLTIEGPIPVTPSFELFEGRRNFPSVAMDRHSRRAYVDIVTSQKYIYALFAGRTFDEAGIRANYARDIHVFAWGGELVSVIRLDRDVATFTVDEDGGRIFAVQHHPAPQIVKFELPASGLVSGIAKSQAGE
ncbi:MAG: TolB-like 6-bladed beta-propeller domain-containing protein [Gemmatimonadetes bacterium]|nr:TolB-like 6-bladed beta-propeller domain-containing protein [Gemmatimonadota bacterium]